MEVDVMHETSESHEMEVDVIYESHEEDYYENGTR